MTPIVSGLEPQSAVAREGEVPLPEFARPAARPTLGTYWRTVRHLRAGQLAALIERRVLPSRTPKRWKSAPVYLRKASPWPVFPEWQPARAIRMLESGEFSFLNATQPSSGAIPWSSQGLPKLWLYNLNYFDFLNVDLSAPDLRFHLRRALDVARDWMARNTTGREVGWEAYPLSLRIVNWLKFLMRNAAMAEALEGGAAVQALLASLRTQTLVLEARLETHLLANHLLKNIKALMFAGALLDAPESSRWWREGEKLLRREVAEQVLSDGGHFERSPMYHVEVLEDLLDLQALVKACNISGGPGRLLSQSVSATAGFLAAILHPDGEIPLMNDSVLEVAPPAVGLLNRAGTQVELISGNRPVEGDPDGPPYSADGLVGRPSRTRAEVTVLPKTGYGVIRDPRSRSYLILDCGPLGPDIQPGHAHCDLLSYEFSLHGQRVVVDTGVSTYEPSPERHFERSTAAHNTLRIDGEEQAEIWASFRVGRRPRVGRLEAGEIKEFYFLRGSHYAYQHRGLVHSRAIVLTPRGCWIVIDSLRGSGNHQVESFIHLHPDVGVERLRDSSGDGLVRESTAWTIRFGEEHYFLATMGGGDVEAQPSWYAPEFGLRQRRTTLHWSWQVDLPATLIYTFTRSGERPPAITKCSDSHAVGIDGVLIPLC